MQNRQTEIVWDTFRTRKRVLLYLPLSADEPATLREDHLQKNETKNPKGD